MALILYIGSNTHMHGRPHAPGPSNIAHAMMFTVSSMQYYVIVEQMYMSIHGLLMLHA